MAYINQINVGGVTYDIQDMRLNNPVEFKGIVGSTATTLQLDKENFTYMWKFSAAGYLYYRTESGYPAYYEPTQVSTHSGYQVKAVYIGDMVFAYDSDEATGTQTAWEIVPSADNPHSHSIPALSGTTSEAASHSHTINSSITVDTAGSHSHNVNNGLSISGTKGTHSHSYVKATQANSAGAHTHSVSIPSKDFDVTVALVADTGAVTGSFSGTEHSHSFTPSGTLDEKGGHSHTFTGTAGNTGYVTTSGTSSLTGAHTHAVAVEGNTAEATATATSSAVSSHSHTFTGTGGNTGWKTTSGTMDQAGAGTYTASVTSNNFYQPTVNGTVLSFTTYSIAVSTEIASHSHGLHMASHSHSFTPAGTIGKDGGHSHDITIAPHSHGIDIDAVAASAGSHSHTLTMASHRHSFTPSGTLGTAGAHSHTFTGTAGNTGKTTQGGSITLYPEWPSYTGSGSIAAFDVQAASAGAHTHALATTDATSGGTNLNLALSGTITLDSAGGHSHGVNATITSSKAGAHSHSVTTDTGNTGTAS